MQTLIQTIYLQLEGKAAQDIGSLSRTRQNAGSIEFGLISSDDNTTLAVYSSAYSETGRF